MEVVRMPKMGMTMQTGEVVRWLKRESERVAFGEPLLEVQTDKTAVEVESPAGGVVVRLLVPEGTVVDVGTPIAVLAAADEQVDGAAIERLLQAATGRAPAAPAAPPPATAEKLAAAPPAPAVTGARATPRVRKLAQDLGVDLAAVTPTGPGGAVTEEDVRRHVGGGRRIRERVPLSGVRKAMAAHMVQSWQAIPHFHQIVDVEAEPLLDLRKQHPYTLTTFFVRASGLALERHPWINAVVEGNEALLLEEVHIGVAISSRNGLVVPTIRDANRKSLGEIAAALTDLSERAQAGRLQPDELTDGTFTVSNLGMFGIETGTPIINAPQVALMFVGAIQKAPVFRGGEVVEGRRFKVTFAYDHRIIDGVMAAAFSQEVRQLLQDPSQLA